MKCSCNRLVDSSAKVCPYCGRRFHPTLRVLGWLAVVAVVLSAVAGVYGSGSPTAGSPVPAAAEDLHQQIVDGSLHACERFVRENSLLQVDSVVDKYEINTKLKDPRIEAWVEVRYRAGASGRMLWASCHYAKFGESLARLDNRSGAVR